ncbi:MAG: HAMP domain-containing sensor histidine kinase [Armatimonadota bacterium]
MRSVPRISLRAQLTIAFLVVIFLSWVLSSATAFYFVRQDYQAFRQQVANRTGDASRLPPPPQITWRDVLLGPQRPFTRGLDRPLPPPDVRIQPGLPRLNPQQPGMRQPPNPGFRSPLSPMNGEARGPGPGNGRPGPANTGGDSLLLFSRIAIAVALAVLAGAWLGWRFLRPLGELSQGARMFHAGAFGHRIPLHGGDEFSELATSMNEMADRVSRQIADLEQDAKRRRQILADVAHELRNPVMTLRTMSGALEEGLAEDPERRQRALRSMVRTSDRLFHLVTDLLELAKLDLRELPLHKQPVDLHELIIASLQAHAPAAQAAGITLLPVDGPALTARVDPDRLTQVIDNLLDNAISYAGKGARVQVTLQDGNPLHLIVADTGHGISARHLPYIFDPFYRADAARASGDEHSGLGLRIASALVEAHGGTLALASTESKGTTVTITLPK